MHAAITVHFEEAYRDLAETEQEMLGTLELLEHRLSTSVTTKVTARGYSYAWLFVFVAVTVTVAWLLSKAHLISQKLAHQVLTR